jgi:hypothetical protein
MLDCLGRWIRDLLKTTVRHRKRAQPPMSSEGPTCSIMVVMQVASIVLRAPSLSAGLLSAE